MRGNLTDAKAMGKILQAADIHLVIHILERDEDKLEQNIMTENDVFEYNVACTNSLLQALGKQKRVVRAIMVTSNDSSDPASILGNSCAAAESIWIGKALRCKWNSVILRIPYSEPPWGRSFVDWAYKIWDGGLHIHDVAKCVTTLADQMTNGFYPEYFRGEPLVLKNSTMPISNPTQKQRSTAMKYGLNMEQTSDVRSSAEAKMDVVCTTGQKDFMEDRNVARSSLLRGWTLEYGREEILQDLHIFGYQGPPLPSWLVSTKCNLFSNNDGISALHLGNN